jgi:hypothetical protein
VPDLSVLELRLIGFEPNGSPMVGALGKRDHLQVNLRC